MITGIDVVLDGTYNTRSVGRPDQPWLYRSAALDTLTDDGRRMLGELGIGLVLDLRDDHERGIAAHSVPVRRVPLYGPSGGPLTGRLEDVYEQLLRSRGRELTAAVAEIADSPFPVLVHCTAGKDRTGLVIALALLVAGWTVDEVVADYALSAPAVEPVRGAMVSALLATLTLDPAARRDERRLQLDSPAEAMLHALGVLDEFGGPHAYLLRHGFTPDQFSALRLRLTDGGDA
ncbi:tyrosine-protein phosphatase [Planctomonas psychrotolerans]|uniref:tyrosine-protein phosphatase n=1 Tax=Planctomonas psychrotolerans TaxID=2528712 RepID=UPI00123AB64E|nr:tyrosine-protein phosphatase [Planctomonas psychrotolerans]